MERKSKMNWIRLENKNYTGLTVKEVKCPVCKYKETYIFGNAPGTCYICGTIMKEKKDNE